MTVKLFISNVVTFMIKYMNSTMVGSKGKKLEYKEKYNFKSIDFRLKPIDSIVYRLYSL